MINEVEFLVVFTTKTPEQVYSSHYEPELLISRYDFPCQYVIANT